MRHTYECVQQTHTTAPLQRGTAINTDEQPQSLYEQGKQAWRTSRQPNGKVYSRVVDA